MISTEEKLKFKMILGHRYVSQIKEVLNERNIIDGSGKAYSDGMIRQVFNGNSENFEIESAIIEAAKRQKEFISNLKKQKNTILK
ncbi:MAG: hypothetical protein WC389_00020 [Lutibacter sp.]|jgi:hypothetical protein